MVLLGQGNSWWSEFLGSAFDMVASVHPYATMSTVKYLSLPVSHWNVSLRGFRERETGSRLFG